MKEKIPVINLKELAGMDYLFGNDKGREVFSKLNSELLKFPANDIFCISLKGIVATDASFPRESVIFLAKSLRGEKGLFLRDFKSKDLIDNWDYGCKAKDQPMIVILDGGGYMVLGPQIPESTKALLDFVMQERTVTTAKVAKKFDVAAQNASGRLKKLHSLGLVLGRKEVAESGGLEFIYSAIGN